MSQVACPKCSKQTVVTPQLQGRKVQCGCGQVFRLPGDKVEVGNASQAAAQAGPTSQTRGHEASPSGSGNRRASHPNPGNAAPDKQSVICPECLAVISLRSEMLGKRIKAPCGHTFVAQTQQADPLAAEWVEPELVEPLDPLFAPDLIQQTSSSTQPRDLNSGRNFQAGSTPAPAGNPFHSSEQMPAYLRPGGLEAANQNKRKVVYETVKSTKSGTGNVSSLKQLGGLVMILAGVGVIIFMAYAGYEFYNGGVQKIKLKSIVGLVILAGFLFTAGGRLMSGQSLWEQKEE